MLSFLLIVGSCLLLHAAYSCLHYRELLKDLQDDSGLATTTTTLQVPPLDVQWEMWAGWGMILIHELIRSGSALRPTVRNSHTKTSGTIMGALYQTRDFDIYSSRAKAL